MTSADIVSFIKKQPIGATCGLLGLLFAIQIYFQTGRIEDYQTEYDLKSADAVKITANVTASKNLPEQVREIQAQVKEMESRLVRAERLAVNLQYFYKLEAETEVKLLDVHQNGVIKGGSGYNSVPFTVSIQGSYKQVMVFLNRLENGRHFPRFNSAVLGKAAGGDSSQNMMILTLSFELFGQP